MLRQRQVQTRVINVNGAPVKMIMPNQDRVFVLIQNQSSVESIQVSFSQNSTFGLTIGPSGAFLIDHSDGSEIWARNPANNNNVSVGLFEILGLNAYENASLTQLENININLTNLVELISGGPIG